jgi:hypothetical protein
LEAVTQAATPGARRRRTLTESLLTIVLTLEAILVFFIALTVYGLHALSPALAFGGGAALFVILLAATRLMRYSWGVWIGWVLQVVILATGLVLPALYIAAVFFIAIWVFCFVRGRQVDSQNHTLASDTEPKETP